MRVAFVKWSGLIIILSTALWRSLVLRWLQMRSHSTWLSLQGVSEDPCLLPPSTAPFHVRRDLHSIGLLHDNSVPNNFFWKTTTQPVQNVM